jgi:hypothetical protein
MAATLYTGYGLLNGFDMANQYILKQPVPFIILTSLAIAMIPVSGRIEDEVANLIKQLGFSGVIVFSIMLFSIFYYWGTGGPDGLIQNLTYYFSYFGAVAGFLSVLGATALGTEL